MPVARACLPSAVGGLRLWRRLFILLRMKIATFNINNVNKRLANLLAWLHAAKPDVVCLQELKAAESEFPQKAIEQAGYGAAWRG